MARSRSKAKRDLQIETKKIWRKLLGFKKGDLVRFTELGPVWDSPNRKIKIGEIPQGGLAIVLNHTSEGIEVRIMSECSFFDQVIIVTKDILELIEVKELRTRKV